MGGTFSFTSVASANLREKNDFINNAIGGACAGSLPGLAGMFGPLADCLTVAERT